MGEPRWKKYLTDYNEGLGLVYERLVLNDYLDRLLDGYEVVRVLEAPLFGMAGVSGINSVHLAQRGCEVTLVDVDAERLEGVQRIWRELNLPCRFVPHENLAELPFEDDSFDLVWQWAGLWYLPDARGLLAELVRVSRQLVFVAMPNRLQVGYWLRKLFVDREFFDSVDERWANMGLIKRSLTEQGLTLVEEGVLDVPPWPDTVMPAAELLGRLGIRSRRLNDRFSGDDWQWSTMDYYLGKRPDLRSTVDGYAFLERLRLPWQLKAVWAHHRYLLGSKG
ncbi:MAG TPA: class I SAM-dependent methyltransferase [Anaerolineae bacterium]|nr:class I SAM-dependent methyltransferase [Anaerolineae bacterium]